MTPNLFRKAQRQRVKLKLAITGPAGSGKTTAALKLARGLTQNGKVAVIDTENRSASLYADLFEFDVLDLEPPFEDRKFSEGIHAAVEAGYDAAIRAIVKHNQHIPGLRIWKEASTIIRN
jgi:adenylylsulfate kinase-like enzyme